MNALTVNRKKHPEINGFVVIPGLSLWGVFAHWKTGRSLG
jgi:hypothetical protein